MIGVTASGDMGPEERNVHQPSLGQFSCCWDISAGLGVSEPLRYAPGACSRRTRPANWKQPVQCSACKYMLQLLVPDIKGRAGRVTGGRTWLQNCILLSNHVSLFF